ncbi:MAG: hypothetical protein ACQEQG_07130 [Bacillota bacterium]
MKLKNPRDLTALQDASFARGGVNRFDEYDPRLKENSYSVEGYCT